MLRIPIGQQNALYYFVRYHLHYDNNYTADKISDLCHHDTTCFIYLYSKSLQAKTIWFVG